MSRKEAWHDRELTCCIYVCARHVVSVVCKATGVILTSLESEFRRDQREGKLERGAAQN